MSDFVTIANKTYTPSGSNTIVQFDLCFAAEQIGASKISGALIDLDYQYSFVSNSQVINPTFSYPDGFGGQKIATVWSDPPTINLSGALSTGKIALVADPAHLDQNPIVGTNGKVLTVQLLVSGNVTDFAVSLQSDANSGDNYITTADEVKHDLDGGALPSNVPATFSGDDTGNVVEDSGSYTHAGTLIVSDVDSATTVTAQTNTPGTYGTFSIGTNGVWTYTADNTKLQALGGTTPTATDTFAVTTADGTTHNMVLTLTGVNDAATFSGSSTSGVTEDSGSYNIGGTLTVSDVDSATTVTAQTNTAGTYGTFSIGTSGVWTYTADNTKLQALGGTTPTATDTFAVTTVDGTTHNIVVTLAGVNDAATFSGSSTGGVTENSGSYNIGGTMTVSDVDSATTVTAQTNTAGTYGTFSISTNGVWTYTADNTKLKSLGGTTPTATETFAVTTADGIAHNIVITLTGINDAPTGDVIINGAATQNVLLTASTETIADLDGLGTFSYKWKADGSDISLATGSTYTLTQAEVGKTVTVVASYTDGYGTTEHVTSTATGIVTNVNDRPTGGVVINGTPSRGATLTADITTLEDADGPGTIHYQWQADNSDIANAIGKTFLLTAAEVGKTVTVVASYIDNYGENEHVTSAATGAVAEHQNNPPTGSVDIAGTPLQGQQLTASNTLADADVLGTIIYQWKAGSSIINGATNSTYTLTEAEVGKTVTVVASYTDGFGVIESKESGATSTVDNVNDAPTGSVTITGTASQNAILTALNDLHDLDGTGAITYQWKSGGSDINGGISSTYKLTEAEVGKTVTVVAGYTDGHDTVEHVPSAATGAVENVNDTPTGSVTIAGTAIQGQQLTASNTLVDLDGPGTITYQWKSGGSDINGAISSTYTLTEAEVGKTVTVVASYTDRHDTAEHVASAATGTVENVNDAPTGEVKISGKPIQGETLTASSTLDDPDGNDTLTYQWRADGVNIASATGTTLKLGAAQKDKVITVQASYVDGHGTAEHVSSTATAAVVGTQSGLVQDGYLSHALVWVDSIANGTRDEGESWTLTDSTGQFTGLVGTGTIRITANPANPPGTIDISTGEAFTGNYSAPTGSTVVNPLTTLVVAAIAAGGDANSVKTALGLDANLNLSTYDALAEAAKTGSSSADVAIALKVQSAAIQIANIMDIATSVAEGGGASSSDIAKVAADVASTLIGATPGTTINLADSGVISAALNSALVNVTTAPTADTVTALAATAAKVNDTIVAAAGQTGGATALASLTKMVQAQIVAQDVAQTMQDTNSFIALTTDQVNTQITAASSGVKDIFKNHAPTGDVTMTGTATQGQTLTAHNTLADTDGPGTISYQWYAGTDAVSGATGSELVLGEAQVGKAISVKASYTDGAGKPESMSSNAATILSQSAPTGSVAIAGTVANGNTLKASNTLADVDGLGTISYQWYSGSNAISGATTHTWIAHSLQAGDTLSVKASYTDGNGTVESVSSSVISYGTTLDDDVTHVIKPANSADPVGLQSRLVELSALASNAEVQAAIADYYAHLATASDVVVRSVSFANPTGTIFKVTSSGHEALVIDTAGLPVGSELDLNNVDFALITGGDVTIRGGEGDNIVFAGAGHQDIILGPGDDSIHGGADNDNIGSLEGKDQLYGDAGNDTLSGGADNDTLYGGTGNDSLDGGPGDDTTVFSGNFSDYTIIRLDETHFKIIDTKTFDGDDGTDIVTNVEHFQFTNGTYNQDEIITANPYVDVHHGLSHDTTLIGLGGLGLVGLIAFL